MKVLLTGAFGNLGSLVVETLLERKHHVVASDVPSPVNRKIARGFERNPDVEIAWGDIRDAERVASLVHRVDAVIHLAAIIPPFSERNPELARAVNVGGTENIVRAIESAARPALLIFGSSISVFGPRKQGDPLCSPNDAVVKTDHYSGHKIQCEERIQALASPWAILRLAGMIDGRLRQRDPAQARMAFSLAPDSPVEYVHTSDAATAIVNVLDRPESHDRILLIGGGRECQVTVLQLTQTLIGAYGIQVRADDMGDVPAAAPWLDTTESQQLLSYQRYTAEDFRRESLERFRFVRPFVRPLSPLIMRAVKWWLHKGDPS